MSLNACPGTLPPVRVGVPPGIPKIHKKITEKQVPEKRAQGLQMEAQRDQKSTKNVKKGALETGSRKDTKKEGLGPSKTEVSH